MKCEKITSNLNALLDTKSESDIPRCRFSKIYLILFNIKILILKLKFGYLLFVFF